MTILKTQQMTKMQQAIEFVTLANVTTWELPQPPHPPSPQFPQAMTLVLAKSLHGKALQVLLPEWK